MGRSPTARKGWEIVAEGDDVHVIPLGDHKEHDVDDHCWCATTRQDDAPWVVTHHSADKREEHELH